MSWVASQMIITYHAQRQIIIASESLISNKKVTSFEMFHFPVEVNQKIFISF